MSATIQEEFQPKQLLKLTGPGFGKIQLFDDVNFPTLIGVFKYFPSKDESIMRNINLRDPKNYKLYIYDTITQRLVHTFENCREIQSQKYLFNSFEDNELYYDKTTKIMVRTEYNNNIYKIIKFEINYTNQFTLEKIYENSIDTTGYGEKCIVHLPFLSPTFILYAKPREPVIRPDGTMIVEDYRRCTIHPLPKIESVKHAKIAFFDSNDITIKDSFGSYIPGVVRVVNDIKNAVFKQRYILLHTNDPGGKTLSWMLYDFVNMNCIKNWNFTSTNINSTTNIDSSTPDMIVFRNIEGIEIYNFESNNDIPEDEACNICMERITEKYAIIPCGHTQTCHSCLDQLTNCPMCRGDKTSILKIY